MFPKKGQNNEQITAKNASIKTRILRLSVQEHSASTIETQINQ